MKIKDFINSKSPLKNENIELIKKLYNLKDLSEEILSFISALDQTIFFDDEEVRLLSLQEIVDADIDLGTEFIVEKLLPLFDLGDNDFIVYDFNNKNWCKYNIAENFKFSCKNNINDILK